jgi:beta-lactamase class A
MRMEISRRGFLGGLGGLGVLALCCTRRPREPHGVAELRAKDQFAGIEARIGGRLGVYVLATDSGASLSHRPSERFAMCSTFKWALVAAVLAASEQGKLALTEEVTYGAADLLEYAPVTREHASEGHMTIRELAEAAITVSDNTAANLLLRRIGGPAGLTSFLREHGDTVTRLDRDEPMLNTNFAADPRDTTSPEAMVRTLRRLLLASVLSPVSRELLLGWMVASRTGAERIRAGLPGNWRVGDKTGTGSNGACNDVAAARPPNRGAILIAVYMDGSSASVATLSAAHADVGRIVSTWLNG